MNKVTGWAFASAVIVVLGACTTETTANSDGGPSSGSAGSAGSSTTGGGGSGGGGGGAGGSSDDGGTCAPSASAKACETCAFSKCMTEICDCKGVSGCNDGLDEYLKCITDLDGGDMKTCAENLVTPAGTGAGKAD